MLFREKNNKRNIYQSNDTIFLNLTKDYKLPINKNSKKF